MNNLTITYIILACGETQVFQLIDKLKLQKDKEDRIFVLNDPTTLEYEQQLKAKGVFVFNHKLNQDYSEHRNSIIPRIKTNYQVWLDADESLSIKLQQDLKHILTETNADAVWCPRLNKVSGVLPIHALMYGWSLQGEICNYPDMQLRILKNNRGIKFVGKLHERPKPSKEHKVIQLPLNQDLDIIHIKTIEQQLKTNLRYNTEYSIEDNLGNTTQQLLNN